LKCAAPEGRIVVAGFASAKVPEIKANLLLVKNIDVIGFNLGLYIGWSPVDERERYSAQMATMVRTLFGMLGRRELPRLSVDVYPIAEFEKAFDAIVGRRSVGRVILAI
jgi:NADPH2:quinone reductase